MDNNVFVITGATGHIGKRVAEVLLAKGKKVRAVGRDPEKLLDLVKHGAEAAVGTLEDKGFLAKAFHGAKGLLVLIPPNYTTDDLRGFQNKVGQAMAEAAEKAGITHIITVSSLGAQSEKAPGPIAGLYENEKRFNKIAEANVLHLRCGYFMENNLNSLPVIKSAGINGTPIKQDVKISMVATQDIAEETANLFLKLDFTGKTVRELLGPSDVTMKEATAILGESIGQKDLKYVEFSYQDLENALRGMGFSQNVSASFVDMYRGFNEGKINSVEAPAHQIRTKTTLKEFSKTIFSVAFSKQ